jgi:hypothetical protein
MTDERGSYATTYSRLGAAAFLCISPRTFDRIQKKHIIPFVLVGQRRRYLQSDLENYLRSNRSI